MRVPNSEQVNQHNVTQRLYFFPNGYGASVVCGPGTYGYNAGLWELAVIRFREKGSEKFDIVYDTSVTDDVLGYLKDEDVDRYLTEIEALPPYYKDDETPLATNEDIKKILGEK